jgi:hypothetical protein
VLRILFLCVRGHLSLAANVGNSVDTVRMVTLALIDLAKARHARLRYVTPAPRAMIQCLAS